MTTRAVVVWEGPVELSVTRAPATLPAELEAQVQELWEAERERRPLVNGSIVCVERMTDARIEGRLVQYRLFVARERSPELRERLALRAVGVSGALVFANGDVLIGRRGQAVTEYPGAWELVPSGGVGAGAVGENGRVDTLAVLLNELEEEVGIGREAVARVRPLGVVYDPGQDGFDICFELRLAGETALREADGVEYVDLRAVPVRDAELLLAAGPAVPVSRTILGMLALSGE